MTLANEFRAGLRDGKLLIQECRMCGRPNMYPRTRCPHCHGDELGWEEARGAGVLHSYTVVRAVPPAGFGDQVPYGLGVVKLAEGVQLLGRLQPVDGDWVAYRCDAEVRFDPDVTSDSPAPDVAWFRPAEGSR